MSSSVEEAEKLLKKAHKLCSPSLFDFRLKPDWEAAAPLLEQAALKFKVASLPARALECFERASTAQAKQGSPWHAAKHLEVCGELSRAMGNAAAISAGYYRQATSMFLESGKTIAGADCSARGAKALDESSPDEALKLYLEALDLYESEDREANASDVFRQMRFGAAADKTGSLNAQRKAYLGAVVTWLYAEQGRDAWQTFQDCMQVESFCSCDEAFAADALLQQFRSGTAESIKQVVASKACFRNLDNQVGKLAVRLPVGKLEKTQKELRGAMGPGSDDGDEGGDEDGSDDGVL
ncbi:MAG: hypothetical protein WDW36_005142 [Sanguina aurantia]